jgi:hypothetical protein
MVRLFFLENEPHIPKIKGCKDFISYLEKVSDECDLRYLF